MRLGKPRRAIDAEVQNRRTIDQITIVTQPTLPDRQELVDSMLHFCSHRGNSRLGCPRSNLHPNRVWYNVVEDFPRSQADLGVA